MVSRHRQKIGALLGMVAILLSTIAPTLSQVLLSAQAGHQAHRFHQHWHHAPHSAEALHLAHVGSGPHHHGPDSSLFCDACPYCGLNAHAPALPGAPVAFIGAIQRARFAPPISSVAFRPYTVVTRAQPRAPPALS
jgi:hypothetical protein